MGKKSDGFDYCMGYRDLHGDFDCEHEYANEINCDECKYGKYSALGITKGLDPRFPRDQQPISTSD